MILKFQAYKLLIAVSLVFSIPVFLFQNCSNTKLELAPLSNPNRNPLDEARNSSGVVAAPGLVKSKLIAGVEVEGYEPGVWLYLTLNDQCVIDRKDEILKDKLYLADSYLADKFDFTKPLGTFKFSLMAVKTTKFISKVDIDNASRVDECVVNLIVSDSYFEIKITDNIVNGSEGAAWNDVHLDNSVLTRLSALHGNKKVNVGLSVYGITNTSGIAFSPNTEGVVWSDASGEGSYLGSLIAGPAAYGLQGAAKEVAQITPSVFSGGVMTPMSLFYSVKDLVNRGAEVIYIPQEIIPDQPTFCNTIVGQAMFYAVERGVTIVVQAGTENLLGHGPGEIVGPRDYNLWEKTRTNAPACWSRYFRGVISVGGKVLGTDTLVSNTNWGVDGIELLAPAQNVLGLNQNKKISKVDSPASGAALVTSAVSHIISFYKAKGWYYSPWLIEDILMNGSRLSGTLPLEGKTVRSQKILDFEVLTTYLSDLSTKTEKEARKAYTENPEVGQGINLGAITVGERPIKLDVFTKISDVYYKDRTQFQAVFYYASGAVKVVTDQVRWSSTDPTNFPIETNGVVYPAKTGAFTISAVDPVSGMSGNFTATAVDYDRISGQNSDLVEIFMVPVPDPRQKDSFTQIDKTHYQLKGTAMEFLLRARYANGEVRAISSWASYAMRYKDISLMTYSPAPSGFDSIRFNNGTNVFGGVDNDFYVFYRGQKFEFKIFVEPYKFLGWSWNLQPNPVIGLPTVKSGPLLKTVKQISENQHQIFKGVRYSQEIARMPLCEFANGNQDFCPGYTSYFSVLDKSKSSLMNERGFLASQTPATLGNFNLFHAIKFRGAGLDEERTFNLQVEVLDVEMTTIIESIAFDIRTPMFSNVKPSSTSKPNINQIAPMCMEIGFDLRKQNTELEIKQYYKTVPGWSVDPSVGTVTFKNGAADISSSILKMNGFAGMVVKTPINPITVEFKHVEASLTKSLNTTTVFTDDPMSSSLSGVGELAALGLPTIKALPELPPLKAADVDCSNSPDPATGFRRGDGKTPETAFLLCSYADFLTISNLPVGIKLYLKLGDNIDLKDAALFLNRFGEKTYLQGTSLHVYLDGNFYRLSNANFVDREANVNMLNVSQAKNLVFTNNSVIARTLSHTSADVENIYSYDNVFEAYYYRGISNYSSARNCFTKNKISYTDQAFSIADNTMSSFAQDDVRFVGIAGSGTYYGLGRNIAFSGSASSIVNGREIGGVAGDFCYRCYSKVAITATNASVIGGILLHATFGLGNIEIGESEANINAIGTTVVGGLIGDVSYNSLQNPEYQILGQKVFLNYGHIHIMNSSFSGNIITSGTAGGFIGEDLLFVSPYFSNSKMSGTLSGTGAKLGAYVGLMNRSCISERKSIKVRGNTVHGSLPAVGNYYGAASPLGVLVNF
jgi:hypothetical protein